MEKGWAGEKAGRRDDTVVKMLTSHQSRSGSIPNQCHMWVEFVGGSHLAERVFLQFFSLQKNQHLQIPIPPGQIRGPT